MLKLIGRKAGLRRLAADVHLQQHVLHDAGLGGFLLDGVQQMLTVHALDEAGAAQHLFDLVGLQMPDEMDGGTFVGILAELLGQLLKKQEEPFVILAVISKELRRIYTARIALDNGRDKLWLMELWGMRSDYPARLLLEAARKTTSEWCSGTLLMCQQLDRRMKSEKGIDNEGELKLLLMRLAQGK